MRKHTHTDAHAGPQQRRQREETDRGKPLERLITGLDKLHFNCDHESRLDARLVFSPLTTAAIELRSLDDKMVVFQNNNVLKFCMNYCLGRLALGLSCCCWDQHLKLSGIETGRLKGHMQISTSSNTVLYRVASLHGSRALQFLSDPEQEKQLEKMDGLTVAFHLPHPHFWELGSN